ncbi:hypothetical protein L1O59_004418 [Salmonella enterica]|nr:hypothetical protein [Salmonella enterica]ECD2093702.1 hypothetical protein [Salmonella enterica subsp. enterica serovar Poano]ECD5543942.1 hypothetical protein [Salmonella enterica subsp. enterica serovar Kokomlemle]ECD6160858.1 hypothetical protein [Salmonella enterica subsp. enterica]ECU7994142.1 hypothetical protein [Salmonella enterica subsp. enterica serovar Toucra]
MKKIIYLLLLASFHTFAMGENIYDYKNLIGYTVIAVSKIDGNFDGCDYRKPIALENDMVLRCSSLDFGYAYYPMVVVLSKDMGKGYSIKTIIDNKVYDMEPILKSNKRH